MTGKWAFHNRDLVAADEARVGVDDVDFAYGYGVYESLKVRKGKVFFVERHVERLIRSATIIGVAHGYTPAFLRDAIGACCEANTLVDANIKVLLVGKGSAWNPAGVEAEGHADLWVFASNPLFPRRQDYRDGAAACLVPGERQFPEAKSLNMLVSTVAYRFARERNCYDALLVNRDGVLCEGTRTNLLWTDGDRVFTTRSNLVLKGITLETIAEALAEEHIPVEESLLHLEEVTSANPPAMALCSTSSKIMPISSVRSHTAPGFQSSMWNTSPLHLPVDDIHLPVPDIWRRCIKIYDAWLERFSGTPR